MIFSLFFFRSTKNYTVFGALYTHSKCLTYPHTRVRYIVEYVCAAQFVICFRKLRPFVLDAHIYVTNFSLHSDHKFSISCAYDITQESCENYGLFIVRKILDSTGKTKKLYVRLNVKKTCNFKTNSFLTTLRL